MQVTVSIIIASSKVFWTSDLQMLRSRVMARFANLECHCSLFRTVRSKTCPWSVATLLSFAL